MDSEALSRQAAALAPDLVAWRRHLHTFPELSYEERRTAEFVVQHLTEWSLAVERPTETGVVATITGSTITGSTITGSTITGDPVAGTGARPGPTVALRADIDALPVQEENEVPYASRHPGVMHACGHDGHTAILLGVARMLQAMAQAGQLPGRVKLIFQPAEEKPPGGALALIEAGVLEGVDAILGLHLWSDFPVGTAGVRSGPVMANADEFQVVIHGQGGHGSQPHQGVDALVVAAQLVLNLQTIVSRRVPPLQPVVVSVGTLRAGYTFNVIAPTATLTGTVRTFDEATRRRVREEMARIVEHTCAMAGATAEFEFFGGYPAVVNDQRVMAVMGEAAGEVLGAAGVREMAPLMGGEDFAYFAREVPAGYLFLGAGNPEQGIIHPHHHPRFDIDEAALPQGVEIFVRSALKFLERGGLPGATGGPSGA